MSFHRPKEQILTSFNFHFFGPWKLLPLKKAIDALINIWINTQIQLPHIFLMWKHNTQYLAYRISWNTTLGVTLSVDGAGTFYPSGATEFTPFNSGVHVVQTFFFCLVFCRPLFVPLSFFFWSLHCLFFVEIWHPDLLFGTFFVEIMILLFGILKLLFSRQSSNPEQKS